VNDRAGISVCDAARWVPSLAAGGFPPPPGGAARAPRKTPCSLADLPTFTTPRSVNVRRLREFSATLPPFHPEPRETRRYAIVVPCYNHAKFLPQAFESIEAQTLPPSEVILIDDQSTDSTWQVLGDLAAASRLTDELLPST